MKEPSKEELEIKKIYQGYLSEELSRPEVRLSKKQLIETYFPKEPVFLLSPRVLAPAFALLVAFVLLTFYHPRVELPVAPKKEPPVAVAPAPEVQVRRVTSRVGPTMVYQKLYREVPVTIIWVFTGGNHQ